MDVVLLTSVAPVTGHGNIYRGLGAYQIAWYLRQHGYEVQVIDFLKFIPEEDIMQALRKYVTEETKIVGLGLLTVPSQHLDLYIKMTSVLSRIRVEFPWVKIVGGGPTGNRFDQDFRRKTFDYICVGHAEDSMLALANYLVRNGPPPMFEVSPLSGHKIIKESLSMPVDTKFDIQHCRHEWHERDFIQPGEALPIETTRGCIFKCKFCAYPLIGKNKRDFLRDMQLIKEEMISNYEKYGTTNYYVLDDTFNADKERVEEFANMVKSLPFKIRYATYLRLDLVEAHPQTEDMLLESGLLGAFFGIESFNTEAALMIGKAFSGKKAKDFLPQLYDRWKDDVSVFLAFIVGFPQETFEECRATNQWCIDSGINGWGWNALYLSNNTVNEWSSEFERNAKDYGFTFIKKNIWATANSSYEVALKHAQQLRDEAGQYQRIASWSVPEVLNYGHFNTKNILKATVLEVEYTGLIRDLRTAWVKRYWAQLMNG
jgi:radical SAM superfamily enzyme YgiQ (UPF0313 family)